jgi:hypothetical protein
MMAGSTSSRGSRPEASNERANPTADDATAPPRAADPRSVGEALDRARQHTRQALAEAIAAGRALLDATSLGLSGEPAGEHRLVADLARALDQASEALSSKDGPFSPGAMHVVLDALDAEIERWEQRSRDDDDARAVLRAFLGLREILWELGLRPRSQSDPSPSAAPERTPRTTGRATKRGGRSANRVQHVTIEG